MVLRYGDAVGGSVVFADTRGEVIERGACDADIGVYWP